MQCDHTPRGAARARAADGVHHRHRLSAKVAADPGKGRRTLASREQASAARSNEREKTQVCLYASNIAACIGMNPYKGPHKALEEMWINQFPTSYKAAVAKIERDMNIKVQTEKEAIKVATSKHRVTNVVKAAIDQSAATTTSAGAVAIDATAKQVIANTVSKRAIKTATQVLKEAGQDFARPVKMHVQQVLGAELPMDKKVAAVRHALQSGGDMSSEAQKAGNKIVDTLSIASAEAVLIQQHVQREIYTGHGTRSEAPAIQVYARRYHRVVREETRFRIKPLTALACKREVLIGGKVDGIATCQGEDILVEVKNRMKRLFAEAPIYEKVQTQALLEILGLERGELVQCLRYSVFGQEELQMQVLPFSKDKVMWKEQLEPKILDFCLLFDSFLDNGDMMRNFLACKTDERAKEKLVLDWLDCPPLA